MNAKQRNSFWVGLRVMGRADLREILRIEADSFANPWSERDFIDHLDNPNSVALVAERNGFILGYEVFGIGARRLQLYSCVVRRAFRRHGIGSRLVEKLIAIVADRGADRIAAKIPERNLVAQLSFRHWGFRATRILVTYLLDDQDVYVMEYTMPGRSISSVDAGSGEDELIPCWEVKHC